MTRPSDLLGGLPPLLSEIAEVAGLSAALTLADARGGNRVYFPAPPHLREEHPLVKIVGREAAMKICEHFAKLGGIELEVPRGPTGSRADQTRLLAQLIEEGVPSGIITRRLGISRRTVARHRARMRLADDRPTDCFRSSTKR
jgi:hypothetical protein